MRLSNRSLAIVLGICAAVGGAGAHAHEFWVEPTAFSIERSGRIGVRLCIGDGYEGWSQTRNAARIESFVASGPSGVQPVVGLDGADPAGALGLTAPGDYVIAYRSDRAYTEMPAAEFDDYLRDKGLDHILAARRTQGATGTVREAYSRHSKALVRVGAGADVPADRAMQLPFELVAETVTAADGWRSFRLLLEGRPLAGALVTAARPGTADADLASRTDAEGRVRFRLPSDGQWRIAAVHMDRAPRGVDAEWESRWASLTFELPSPSSAVSPRSDATRGAACRNRVAAQPALAAR